MLFSLSNFAMFVNFYNYIGNFLFPGVLAVINWAQSDHDGSRIDLGGLDTANPYTETITFK